MKIGDKIKKRREFLGMSQDDLAKKMGYKSRSTINKIEKNINDISQSKIVAFANALETTPSFLMEWEEQETPPSTINNPLIDELVAIAKQLTDHELEQLIAIAKTFIK